MAEIYKIDPINPSLEIIRKVVKVLKNGGVVVYPTDTVYGVGGDPFNEKVVERIFIIKRRGRKPLPILVSSIDVVEEIAYVSETALKLMRHFWPGPLTLVLPVKKKPPPKITLGTGKIGVRMPAHKVPLLLAKELSGAIIGTSANISGHPAPRRVDEVLRELGDLVDIILDAGPTPGGKPSTVVEIDDDRVKIIRKGPISLEEILSVIQK